MSVVLGRARSELPFNPPADMRGIFELSRRFGPEVYAALVEQATGTDVVAA